MCKEILHMKLDPALKKQLREEAEKQNRTLSNYIETILRNRK